MAAGQPSAALLTPPAEVTRLNFQALWKNTPVGSYSFVITPSADGSGMTVSHAFLIRVKIAFVTMFRYEHRVEEVWRAGRLHELSAETIDADGTIHVRAQRTGGAIEIEGPNGGATAPSTLLTTTCAWHPAFIAQNRVLDVSDGGIVALAVNALDAANLVIEGDEVETEHYAFTSPYLAGELWYRPGSTLVRAEIEKKGHRIVLVAHP
ncbi:MAG: hypothetical protein KF815_09915 [Rhodospirillales bacterium]|nr:hypothetical protein [Rhodospirillales bacterium]